MTEDEADRTINTGATVDLDLLTGDTWVREVTIYNDCDKDWPLDISDASFCMEIRPASNSCKKPILVLSTENGAIEKVTDQHFDYYGKIILTIDAEDTLDLKFRGNQLDCVYDLIVVMYPGKDWSTRRVLMRGEFTIYKSVTRDAC